LEGTRTLEKLAFDIVDATITVGDPTLGAFPVTIQLKNAQGGDLSNPRAVFAYLSKDADGSTICTDSTDTSEFVIGTDGLLVETVTDVAGWLVAESDGDIDVVITVITTKKAYLVLVMPDGQLVISDEMAYTAE
jgi:hypothetical protein